MPVTNINASGHGRRGGGRRHVGVSLVGWVMLETVDQLFRSQLADADLVNGGEQRKPENACTFISSRDRGTHEL